MDELKKVKLKAEQGNWFDDVEKAMLNNKGLDDSPNPKQKTYPGQGMSVVDINGYAYLVPYVENSEFIFLKTIIPNRNATKKYLTKGK